MAENFVFHDIFTDSEHLLKDICKILALGCQSDIYISGPMALPKNNWSLVYPAPDQTQFPEIENWSMLTAEEYEAVTKHQIEAIGDKVILKTAPAKSGSPEMFLEIYFPPYLSDTETDDPFLEKEGVIPEFNGRSYKNYMHVFMRIFDVINDAGDGPKENGIDPVTRQVNERHSAASPWVKWSWYQDIELPLVPDDNGKRIRRPAANYLTPQSKIKLWCNINKSHAIFSIMGTPNLDFKSGGCLFSCAYIGQIDSFDFSEEDTVGNFGIFASSTSIPAITQSGTLTHMELWYDAVTKTCVKGIVYNTIGSFPQQLVKDGEALIFSLPVPEDVPSDSATPDAPYGTRYVDPSSIKTMLHYAGTSAILYDANGSQLSAFDGGTMADLIADSAVITKDANDRKVLSVTLTQNSLINQLRYISGYTGTDVAKIIFTGVPEVRAAMKTYLEFTGKTGGVKRTDYGTISDIHYSTAYGANTANGSTDIAMYRTYDGHYFQKHCLMFTSPNKSLQKTLYGKSSYTNDYYSDFIKVVHETDGVRGTLQGLIAVEAATLYPFDEIVFNPEFKRYANQPEKVYLYLPVTAPYNPLGCAPQGIGLLKAMTLPTPTEDIDIVKTAYDELMTKYSSVEAVSSGLVLITKSEHGATITWSSTDPAIAIGTSGVGAVEAAVTQPAHGAGDTSITLTAAISYGTASKTATFSLTVRQGAE